MLCIPTWQPMTPLSTSRGKRMPGKWQSSLWQLWSRPMRTGMTKAPKGSWYADPKAVGIMNVILWSNAPMALTYNMMTRMDLVSLGWSVSGMCIPQMPWAQLSWPCQFLPIVPILATNNETLNNHMCKHYGMGLTCQEDGYTTTSMAAMRTHMESRHDFQSKRMVKK